MREFVLVQKFGDHRSIRAVCQHPDFHARDLTSSGQRIKLRAQRGRRRGVNGNHSLRGLHRQRRDRGNAVTIVRRKSFQVGGNTRAAGRIESRNGQKDRWRVVRMV